MKFSLFVYFILTFRFMQGFIPACKDPMEELRPPKFFNQLTRDASCVVRDVSNVRITLNLDDDVLESVKLLAAQERKPLEVVISDLLRRAVTPAAQAPMERNEILLFPVS